MPAKLKRAIGIDIGTHSVKTVQVSKESGRLLVERAALVRLDQAQAASDPSGAAVNALERALQGFMRKKVGIVLALPGQSAVIRYPRLPKMPEEELRGAIEIEAGQNIPYDLDQVTLDSELLEEVTENDQSVMKVLLVAAKNDVVSSRVSLAQAVGLSPHLLGVDSLALADAAEVNDEFTPEETVALINMGASSTNIHFCKGGISNFIRDITWGGKELTAAIQRTLRVDFDEAERIKAAFEDKTTTPPAAAQAQPGSTGPVAISAAAELMGGGEEDEASRIKSVTESIIARLIGEVRRSFDYYEQQLYEKRVDRIILSGGSVEFASIRDAFLNQLAVPSVEIANPIKKLSVTGSQTDALPLTSHPSHFMVAVGLACRGITI